MNWPHYMKKREEWYVDYCNSLVHLGGGGGGGGQGKEVYLVMVGHKYCLITS